MSGRSPNFSSGTFLQGIVGNEAKWTFNGLTLNDRSAIDRYVVTEIAVSDPDLRDSREPIPLAHGEIAYSAYYSGRSINITGRIEAGNLFKLRRMQEDLREAFSTLSEQYLVASTLIGISDIRVRCRKSGPISVGGSNPIRGNMYACDFLIPLRASDFRFLNPVQSSATATFSSGSVTITCYNAGNFDAQARIRIGNATTAVIDPTVTNPLTGQVIKLLSTVATFPSTWIDIETDAQNRYAKDQTGALKWSLVDPAQGPVEFTIKPGINLVSITRTSQVGSPTATVYWYDSWI